MDDKDVPHLRQKEGGIIPVIAFTRVNPGLNDIQNINKMGMCKDLSDFYLEGQIVMVRRLDLSFPKTAGFVESSWYAVVSTYKNSPRNKNR